MTPGQDSWSTYTDTALDRGRRERSEIEQECHAFRRFRQRIQSLETHTPQIQQSSFGVQKVFSHSKRSVRDVIEPCYRETVMAVDHYDDVYGDSFEESINAEFGGDVARQISGATSFSPVLQHRLLDAAQQCLDNRHVFLKTLKDEHIMLEDAHSTVCTIQQTLSESDDDQVETPSNGQLIKRYEQLQSLEDECERWLQRRQQQIHDRQLKRPVDESDDGALCPYLYASLDVTYPILSTFVTVHEQLHTCKQQTFNLFTT